jgi:hypothetical protein
MSLGCFFPFMATERWLASVRPPPGRPPQSATATWALLCITPMSRARRAGGMRPGGAARLADLVRWRRWDLGRAEIGDTPGTISESGAMRL